MRFSALRAVARSWPWPPWRALSPTPREAGLTVVFACSAKNGAKHRAQAKRIDVRR